MCVPNNSPVLSWQIFDVQLNKQELILLSGVPEDGSTVGNQTLLEALG